MMNIILPRLAADGQDSATATYAFLEFIFGAHRSGYAEFRYSLPGPPKTKIESEHIPLPLDRKLIETMVLARRRDHMIAFGPAPRLKPAKKGKAGTDADVAEVGCVWGALDYESAPGGAIEVVRRVKSLTLRPSVVVNSGYGRGVYYVLTEALCDGRLLDWQELTAWLGGALGNSRSAINPSRVMRLPGTLNLEYGLPAPCEIVEEDSSWTRYSLEEVKDFLAAASQLTAAAPSTDHLPSADHEYKAARAPLFVGSVQSAPPNAKNASEAVLAPSIDVLRERDIPRSVIEAIITGKSQSPSGTNAGRGGNSGSGRNDGDEEANRDFWIAASLLAKNFTEAEVKAVFRNHPSGCGSRWTVRKHGEKYLNAVVRKAASNRLVRGDDENARWLPGESLPPNYQTDASGAVWLVAPPANEGREPKLTLVAEAMIYIAEIHENIDNNQISVIIAYEYLSRRRTTKITRAQMREARALVASLSGEGAPVSSVNARLLVAYLTAYEHAFAEFIPRKKVTSKLGRGNNPGNKAFFLPGLISNVEFAPQGAGDASLYRAFAARRGTLQNWIAAVNELADAQLMIPQVAVCAAFVPPLQKSLQIPNFILDIYGNTSSGKSTTLKLAASVFGNPVDPESLIYQWTNTKTAIEQLAAMCSELPIFLDDAQHCAENLKRTAIYMIANGKGKARAGRAGGMQETLTWRTVALSTSEEPLHESSPHEGARGRLLPVGGLTTPFPPNSGAFVQRVERSIAVNHGIAGETFVRHLNGWSEKEWMIRQRRYIDLKTEFLFNSSSDIVGRVSGYIAAVVCAGEIAGPLFGLRFKPDVIGAWLLNHLHEQQNSQNAVLLALRALADHYVANLNSFAGSDSYDFGKRGTLQGVIRRNEYVGFLRTTLDAVFAKRKWNQTMILNKLAEAGALHATETDRHTKKVSFEGIKYRLVCIKWSALLPDDRQMFEG